MCELSIDIDIDDLEPTRRFSALRLVERLILTTILLTPLGRIAICHLCWLVGSFGSAAWQARTRKMFAKIYREKVTQLAASTRRASAADWRRLCCTSILCMLNYCLEWDK